MTTTNQSFDRKAVIKVLARDGQTLQAYAVAASDLTLVTKHTVLKKDDVLAVPPVQPCADKVYFASKANLVPLTKDDLGTRLKAAIEAKDERSFYYQVCLTETEKLSLPRGIYRETALHHAVILGNQNIFETVLKRMSDGGILEDADTETGRMSISYGGNVLNYIAIHGQTQMARSLAALKPDLVQQLMHDGGYNQPLTIALIKGNFELACLLFEYADYNCNKGTYDGKLIGAIFTDVVREKSKRLIEILLGSSCLTIHEKTVASKLLINGPLLECTDYRGFNALHAAASCYDQVIFELVYKAYAAAGLLLSKSKGDGTTLLHAIIGSGDSKAVIELINRPDFDPRLLTMSDDWYLNTPLFSAAEMGMSDVFKYLYAITDTNDLLKRNSIGETVLVSAVRGKNMEILNMLLAHPDVGAKLLDTDDNKGTSPLVFAIKSKNAETCQVLYDLMDLRQICKQTKNCGRGAMHWALVYNDADVIDVLTSNHDKYQALLLVKDAFGKTPFQV